MPSGFRKIAAILALIGALAAGYGSYQGLYPSVFAASQQVESLEENPNMMDIRMSLLMKMNRLSAKKIKTVRLMNITVSWTLWEDAGSRRQKSAGNLCRRKSGGPSAR